ncbi:Heme exporter protein CcmD [Psychromonas sp. CNPT3]|uniref:heme exporter protein CcmD n=1 Tax=Psychromonas sp. CNPT3 TaxID=314282 RepID=UPI00006E78E5|nr:heme exporter protein CcmD [Psychromonas sp. CNPT3]AGH82027.1 Heme exporter protein CcmD [Psychromonas sp. CNPT3]
MAFDSINDFFAMGGYGFYVWLSYALFLLSLVIITLHTIYEKRKIFQKVRSRLAREKRIKQAQNLEGTL